MDKKSILVIDDDRNILAIIEMYLKKEGCTVTTCERGDTALEAFHKAKPDLVVLDVMLPGMDGWGVLGKIREESDVPVIMLTAKSDTMDRIQGLDLGADDYMVKPFEAKELIARIKAVMRRSGGQSEEKKVSFDNLVISLDNYSVLLDGKPVEMPPKEIELLYFLASRPGKVFTREQLLEQVWGFDFFGDSRTVDVHVKRIREKLGERKAVLYGPAYKGISIAVSAAVALSRDGLDVPFFFNRKEAKDHGEGGVFVGYVPKAGEDVVIVEDVITAGTAIRESMAILSRLEGVKVAATFIMVDRKERGKGEKLAMEEVEEEFGFPVYSVVDVYDIIAYLEENPANAENVARIRNYLAVNGANA